MMKRFLSTAIFSIILGAATLPDAEHTLKIDAKYFDGNESCVLVNINAKLVGTQKDVYGKDLVKFLVYDDGKVIASKEIALPMGKALERNLTLFYAGRLSTKSPSIALESEELGLYIDPLHYAVIHRSCAPLLSRQIVGQEIGDLCGDLKTIGFKCEGILK